jgi:hypothetical protein
MKRLLLPLWLAACGAPQSATSHADPHAPATAPACPPIAGLDSILARGTMLVFGEIHGTAESPRFAGAVACHAAALGPVTLALELPRDEQPRLDAYLASGGTAADRAALLASPFWTRSAQDGRSSVAMLALIEAQRAARAAGADVAIVAFDLPEDAPRGADRDARMADHLAAARRAAPARTFVTLTGNFHSRRTVGAPWNASARFMAGYLVDAGLALSTFDVERDGGSAWVCPMDETGKTQPCGPRGRPPRPVTDAWSLSTAPTDGHDGHYVVGPTTASPPAVGGGG